MSAELFLGLDAGATKTAACICDHDGTVRAFELGPAGNWESVSVAEAREAFATTIGAALDASDASATDIRAAAFGVAGVDWPGDEELVAGFTQPPGLPPPVVLNDAFPALRAGAPDNVGCVSCAGTGSVTAGRNAAGETFRTLALGIGEQGGAIGLVQDALAAVAAEHHGDGPPTALTERLLDAAAADSVSELFRRSEREHRPLGAEHAPIVLELADAGDVIAAGIAERAGRRLAETAAGVASRLQLSQAAFTLVRAGAVHLAASPALDQAFAETVAELLPRAELALARMPPAAGAALIAIETTGGQAPFDALAGHFQSQALPA